MSGFAASRRSGLFENITVDQFEAWLSFLEHHCHRRAHAEAGLFALHARTLAAIYVL
jgi:hypothetical protein